MTRMLIFAALLSACATHTWTKPGATQEEFARDKWNCAVMAKYMNDNHTWSSGYTQGLLFTQCMNDHG